jgi:uncharacterized protein YbjT (DUF2867 family)
MSIPEIAKPLALSHGFFYITEFSATGGVKYARIGDVDVVERDDESLTAKYKTRKDVDHIGLLKWSRKIVNSAYGVMERHASSTPVGYWIAKDKADLMLSELAQVRAEAESLNNHARSVGSERRCRIDVFALEAGQDSLEAVAVRLAQTVRERLDRLRTDLQAGDLNAYATSWKLAKNLPRLATGIQAESIVLALEAAREKRAELAEAIRAIPESARTDAKLTELGSKLDVDAINAAIHLFTDSVNGTLASVEDPEIDRGVA